MATAPFPVQPYLTAIAIAYRNPVLIADEVLPRVPVGVQDFKYLKHNLADGFTIPDTKVGRRAKPNEVEFQATETSASTQDYGLDDPVPQADIDNAPPNYDPLMRATEGVTDLILLDREKRTADLVFDAAQYATANKTTLSGLSQWSDFTNSDPIAAILNALDGTVMRPNIAVLGQAVYTKLRTHPKVVQAFYGNAATAGVVPREFLAQLLEFDAVLVGQGWLNTAKKGQAVSLARVWGKHCALLYRDRLADANRGVTFGFTAEWGGRVAGSQSDPDIGLRGGQRVRVGESVKELLTANDLGYLFTNAVA
ncbi:MAG: phage capsid protein [Gammaproteobacteria bacterium]